MNTLNTESKLAEKYRYQKLPPELSKKYREYFEENIPTSLKIKGSNDYLYTNNGSIICKGYERIVIGDYGAFIEFTSEQCGDNFAIKDGQEYRVSDPKYSKNVKYIWFTIYDGSDVKIYFQKRKVNYADYKKDMYYVSVHEVKLHEI